MARAPIPVEDEIMSSVEKEEGLPTAEKKDEADGPLYQVIGDQKIPVSKSHGKLWKTRMRAAKNAIQKYSEAWDEAITYYLNDQSASGDSGKDSNGGRNRNRKVTRASRQKGEWVETENLVFANVTTQLPGLYSKNPEAEFTSQIKDDVHIQATKHVQHLMNTVVNMKTAPGPNIKPKARRCVLHALLTNCGWMEIGYNFKQGSSETILKQLEELGTELSTAKDKNKVKEIEGKIIALEKHFDVANPEGLFAKSRPAWEVLIDPETTEPDGSDAQWMMVPDYLPTEYLNARFGKKRDDGQVESLYKPTHILAVAADQSNDDQVNNFSLFTDKDSSEFSKHGYEDEESARRCDRTKVWYVWDKVTRRVYMYASNDWSWPIWVFEDPYRLDRFFPFYRLWFFDSPEGVYQMGEVSYYLDQQDAINDINDQSARAREWAFNHIFFDSKYLTGEDADKLFGGPGPTYRGFKVPENKKLQDLIFTVAPPSLNYPELFDKSSKMEAIDRISSVRDVERGAQFKTNTTNKAIDEYMRSGQLRLDEKIDLIEDWLGDIIWGMTQIALQFFPTQTVADIIGKDAAADWKNFTPDEIRSSFTMQVIGGSTAKPTSRNKKEQAIGLGQTLGQFANASPYVVIMMIKMLERAFDDFVVTDEDWKMIKETMMMNLQKAGSGPGGAGAPGDGGQQLSTPVDAFAAISGQIADAVQLAADQGIAPGQAVQQVFEQLRQGNAQVPPQANTQPV